MSQFNLDLSYNFKGVKARSQSIRDSLEHAENFNMAFANDLAGDVFNALYQHNPSLKVADNSQYSQAIRAAMASPQFQHLRMQTRDSVHWSSTAAALITSKLAEKLAWSKEEQPPQPPQEECEEESKSEEENKDEPQSGGGEPMGEPTKSDEKGDGEPQSSDEFDENSEDSDDSSDSEPEKESDKDDNGDGEESESDSESNDGSEEQNKDNPEGQRSGEPQSPENSDSGESDNDNESEDGDDSEDSDNESDGDSDNEGEPEQSEPAEPVEAPSKDIEHAINEAAKEMDQLMGGIRAGTQESLLGSKEEAALAELYTALGNNDQLSKLMAMIGRMQINQHFLNGISYAETQTPVAITMGRDIKNVLPQDLGLLLGNNEEFSIFATKYRNNELLQREMRAETNAGKGPMIVCLDESGSMMGDKNTWAQSITVAMYLQCVKERRQFALVKFASSARLWPLPANSVRMDIEFMKSILNEGYLGGGTNFGSAWAQATTFIRKNPLWKQADIVFVTDGMGGFNPETMKADKADLNVRLISFFIDPDDSLGRSRSYSGLIDSFIELNDAFTHIQDLSERGEKQAFEIIRQKDAKGYFEVKSGKLKKSESAGITF